MIWNEVTAVIALLMSSLICFGYYPQVKQPRSKATKWIAWCLILAFSVITIRIFYYDVFRSIAVYYGWFNFKSLSSWTEKFNSVSNAWLSSSCFCGLKALEQSVPQRHRDKWPWWRAWYYPKSGFISMTRGE